MLHIRDQTAQSALSIRHLVANLSKTNLNDALSEVPRLPNDSQRYLISTLVRSVMRADRDPSRITLLENVIEYAVTLPEFVTMLCDMFESVPSISAESVTDLLVKQLKVSTKAQLAAIVAVCNATGDTATHGRKVLTRWLDDAAKDAAAAIRAWAAPPHVIVALLAVARTDAALLAGGKAIAREVGAPFEIPKPASLSETAAVLSKSISIAKVIAELGTACVSSDEDAAALMALLPDTITPLSVAQSVTYFACPSTIAASDVPAFSSLKLGFDIRTKSGAAASTQGVITLVQAVKHKYPSLDWNDVVKAMDHPSCRVERFTLIPSAYKKATGQLLPIKHFLGQWGNRMLQGAALRFALTNPELVNRELPTTAAIPQSDVALWSNVLFVEAIVNASISDKECALEIVKAMKAHPHTLMAAFMTMPLAIGMKNLQYAEQLVASVGTSFITSGLIAYVKSNKRLDMFVGVLCTVATQGEARAAAAAAAAAEAEGGSPPPAAAAAAGGAGGAAATAPSAPSATSNVQRMIEIVDVFIKNRLVDLVLAHSTSAKVIVYTVVLSAGSGLLPTNFLADRLGENNRNQPLHPCNRFAIAQAIVEVADELLGKEQHAQAISTALSAFQGAAGIVALLPSLAAQAKALQSAASGLDGSVTFPEDVEKMAKEFLDQTYRLPQTTNETVDHLELWRKSPKPRDQQIFDCIVQILFEETRCLSDYPFKALINAAVLFGQIIARNLLEPSKTQTALKIILQMVVKPTDLKVGEYGIVALDQFKNRLSEWPAFAKQLREIVDLDMRIPGIMCICNTILDGPRRTIDPACLPIPKNTGASASSSQLGLHQHDIRVLMEEAQGPAPPQVIQERINFIVGNTDPSNIEANSAELATLVTPEFYQYFADYLVVKRVSLEPNYHRMYQQLVERLMAPALEQKIRSASIIAVKRLLASDKIRTNSSERSLLKNLGSWLGQITLARDRPVVARYLDFKELIYLGLETGKLIAIVPFIAKVLDGAVTSRVFRPPNPWLMGTLVTLMEMYHLQDLKITLRFEVEVLCKNLGLSVHDVIEYAKANPRPPRIPSMQDIRNGMRDISESTDFRYDESQANDEPAVHKKKLQADATPYQPRQALPIMPEITPVVISSETVRAGPEANILPQANRSQYLQVLAMTLDRTIKELLPHLERSVRIAVHTTRDIVVKDYTRDPDTGRMRRSAQLMARSLATNLANATVFELLRVAIRKNLLPLAQRLSDNENDQQVIIETIVKNNIELCTAAIEYQSSEMAGEYVEKLLQPIVEERQALIHKGEFPVIPNDQLRVAALLSTLPDAILPRSGLHPSHLAVYEHFGHQSNSLELVEQLFATIQDATIKHYQTVPITSPAQVLSLTNVTFTETNQSPHHTVIKQKLVEVSQLINERTAVPLVTHMFPRLMLISEQQQRQDPRTLTLDFCVLSLLSEVCLFVLQSAREKGQGKAIEALTKLYLNHERRWFNRDIAINFIRLSVIDINEFDAALCRALREGTPNQRVVVEFAGFVVQRCLIDDKLTTPRDLRLTLAMLEEIAAASKERAAAGGANGAGAPVAQVAPGVPQQPPMAQVGGIPPQMQPQVAVALAQQQLAAQQRGMVAAAAIPVVEPPKRVRVVSMHNPDLRAEVEQLFAEWIAICNKRPSAEDPTVADGQPVQSAKQLAMGYVSKLQQANKLKADGTLDAFIGLLLELSVEEYSTVAERSARSRAVEPGARPQDAPQARFPPSPNLNTHVDAFADLMGLLIRCCSWSASSAQGASGQPANANPEMALIQKILSVVAKVLIHNHDQFGATPPAPAAGANARLPEGHAFQMQFMQQPYVRFFSDLAISLLTGDTQTDETQFVTLMLNTLNVLAPTRLPGFAFGWLELLCHRVLVAKALKNRALWPLYYKLLAAALKFIDSATRQGEISNPMLLFFKSFLKLMLILLHDFSEFLLVFHQPLCDAIPTCSVQLRNVVLSAFPKSTKLPDPFQDSLKVAALPEMSVAPQIADTAKDAFEGSPIALADVINFCRSRHPPNLPAQVAEAVLAGANDRRLNLPLLNAVVLFSGIATLELTANRVTERVTESPIVDLLTYLVRAFNNEARYQLFNACVNQLRFPNSHTHLFSTLLLHLYDYTGYGSAVLEEMVQEQITRTVVERLIISRPHPWGLLVTFIELAKNPVHKLWEKPFIRCTPEIERVFQTVGKSINGPAAAATAAAAAGGAPSGGAAAGAPGAPGAPGTPGSASGAIGGH